MTPTERVSNSSHWLVTCSCGWGREASSEWAAHAVSRLHRQMADAGTHHVTQVEDPRQAPHAAKQLSFDQGGADDGA